MDQRPMPRGFYATEPHQPTYRPPPPAKDADRGSRLDRQPWRWRADGSVGDDADDSRPHALVAVAVLAVLVLLAVATIVAVSLLHDGSHKPSVPASTSASAPASA